MSMSPLSILLLLKSEGGRRCRGGVPGIKLRTKFRHKAGSGKIIIFSALSIDVLGPICG